MKSPITGKEMKVVREWTTLPYRKDKFKILYHCFECKDTGERFTDDNFDAINQIQVHNLYRERYGIPFPEDIKRIRKKYKLSASKMSKILGFGANTFRLYEEGEVPSVANGRLILAIDEPQEFLKQINASSHILSSKELAELTARVNAIIEEGGKKNSWEKMFEDRIFRNESIDEFTGFKRPSSEKVSQVISYFSSKTRLFKTKLNKLLFYADFVHFQRYGVSITGISYRAIPYGPVPAEYDKLYIKLCDDGKLETQIEWYENGNYGEIFTSKSLETDLLSKNERLVLEAVNNKFEGMTTREIVNYSHREKAWLENKEGKSLISYQKYAFDIKLKTDQLLIQYS